MPCAARFAYFRSAQLWSLALLAVATPPIVATSAEAASNRVEAKFDVGTLIGCRDVTTAEFVDAYPGYKVVEATFYVSLRIVEGDAADLSEIRIEINSPTRRLRVIGFEPHTRLESETVGPIEITTTKEKTRALGANAAGSASLPTLVIPNQFTPSANLGTNQRDVVVEKRSQIPPQQVTLVSGTTNQEHGVFFTLRRSPSFSLEGQHEFVLRWSVPQAWRGDWVQLHCQGRCRSKYFSKSEELCVDTRLAAALFAEGDVETQRLALQVSRLQDRPGAKDHPSNSLIDELLAAPRASMEFSRIALTYPLRWAQKSDQRPSDNGQSPSGNAKQTDSTNPDLTRTQQLASLLGELAAHAGMPRDEAQPGSERHESQPPEAESLDTQLLANPG